MPTQEKNKSNKDLEEKKEIVENEVKLTPKKATIKKAITEIEITEKGVTEKKTENTSVESEKNTETEKELSKQEIFDRFATQRVDSIREELKKSSVRKLENEELDKKEKEAEDVSAKIDALDDDENRNIVEELYKAKGNKIEELENETEEDEEVEEKNDSEEEKTEKEESELGKRSKRKNKKKKSKFLKFIKFMFVLGILGIAALAFLLYGPWDGFRNWYIGTGMTTMNHQWLVRMFYSEDTINEYLNSNKVIEADGVTDNSLITKKSDEELEEQIQYANEFERAVLEKDPNHPDYKILDIEGEGYNGFLAVVYDASKIHTMVTSRLDVVGEYVTTMAEREGAVLAINGGGFDDPNYSSNGGSPTGITYSRGSLITSRGNTGGFGGLIGFTNDDVLTIGRMSVAEADAIGMRDAVTCGPFLIINGESSEVLGNGGWGEAARTVIGQRQDGIVLMLVLNGRNYTTGIIGADMDDLIEIMERYGAYNAACLDGGTSSVIVENGEILNDPIDGKFRHQTRFIPTAFGLFLDE